MALTNAEQQRRYRERRLLRRADIGPDCPRVIAHELDRCVKGGHFRQVYRLLYDWVHADLANALRDLLGEQQRARQGRDARAEAMQASLCRRFAWRLVSVSWSAGAGLADTRGWPFPRELTRIGQRICSSGDLMPDCSGFPSLQPRSPPGSTRAGRWCAETGLGKRSGCKCTLPQ
jgi:hypothetical protein